MISHLTIVDIMHSLGLIRGNIKTMLKCQSYIKERMDHFERRLCKLEEHKTQILKTDFEDVEDRLLKLEHYKNWLLGAGTVVGGIVVLLVNVFAK